MNRPHSLLVAASGSQLGLDVMLSLATIPLLFLLLGGQSLPHLWHSLGQQSQSWLGGQLLPLLTIPQLPNSSENLDEQTG